MRLHSSFFDALRRLSMPALVLLVVLGATTAQNNVSTLATISGNPLCLAPVNNTHVAFAAMTTGLTLGSV
jgi:hypothetical protein